MHYLNPNKMTGQSLVGFLVATIFVLVPAFIGVSYLAKAGELRHKTYEAARYSAWEKVAWPGGGAGHSKSDQQLAWEARYRVMGKPDHVFDSRTDNKAPGSADQAKLDPMLYSAYLNQPGYISVAKGANTSSTGAAVASSTVKSDLGGLLGSAGMKLVVEGLDLDTTGYRKAAVAMPLEDPDQAWIPASNLSMKHHYVLLDNAWNAASPSQAKSRVKNMVPTDLLDNGVIRTGLNLVGYIFPEIRSDNLEFGKVDVEVAPCQRLSTYSGSTAPSACR